MKELEPIEYYENLLYFDDLMMLRWKKRNIESFKDYRAYKTWNSRFADKLAAGQGSGKQKRPYIIINYNRYFLHRIVFFMFHKKDPCGYDIDHIDGNTKNNHPMNLRVATKFQNLQNRGAQSNNSCGYKNVYFHKPASKWRVRVCANGVTYEGGLFANIEDANKKAIEMRSYLHMDFANHK